MINKIKDLMYDTNDILIAVLILACAALVILTRVDNIVTYPERAAALAAASGGGYIRSEAPVDPASITRGETGEAGGTAEAGGSVEAGETAEAGEAGEAGEGGSSEGVVHSAFSLYIAYGEPMSVTAENLVNLGFFDDVSDFFAAIERHNAGTKVQAGDFVIPAASSKDDVIKIITGAN